MPSVRRLLWLVAAGFVVWGVALSLVPFSKPVASGYTAGPGVSTRCRAPIVSAWKVDHDSGWFGYAPLTSTPLSSGFSFPSCRGPARSRLELGALMIAFAIALGFALRPRRAESASTHAP